MTTISRRAMLRGAGAMTALAPATLKHAYSQSGSIKIPMFYALSGPGAVVGEPAKLGAELTAEFVNKSGGINGRPLELMFVDDKGDPNNAVAAMREVLGQGYRLMGGILFSAQSLALLPVITEAKAVLVGDSGTSMLLSHEQFTPYYFSGTTNDYTRAKAQGYFAAKRFPDIQNWSAVCTDSAAYISSYQSFVRFAKEAYAAIGKQPNFADPYRFKFGTTDYRTQLGSLAGSNVDGIWCLVSGADGLSLWQQAASFNLGRKIKAVMDQTTDFNVARVLKKNLPPNLWTLEISYLKPHTTDPYSKAFYDACVARTKTNYPSGYIQYGHSVVTSIVETLKLVKDSSDTDRIIKILETTPFKTADGIIRYRKEDHILLDDIDFANVVPSDDAEGIRVAETLILKSEDYSPPPDPGHPFKG